MRLAAIQREIDANCADPAPYLRAALLLIEHGRPADAAPYLEDAVELAPDATDLLALRARLGAEAGE